MTSLVPRPHPQKREWVWRSLGPKPSRLRVFNCAWVENIEGLGWNVTWGRARPVALHMYMRKYVNPKVAFHQSGTTRYGICHADADMRVQSLYPRVDPSILWASCWTQASRNHRYYLAYMSTSLYFTKFGAFGGSVKKITWRYTLTVPSTKKMVLGIHVWFRSLSNNPQANKLGLGCSYILLVGGYVIGFIKCSSCDDLVAVAVNAMTFTEEGKRARHSPMHP